MTEPQLMTSDALRRVQARLTVDDYQFALNRTADGWEWDIVGNPLHTPQVFASPKMAIEHADRWTELWHPLPEESYHIALAA
jgi:hypothetical protein